MPTVSIEGNLNSAFSKKRLFNISDSIDVNIYVTGSDTLITSDFTFFVEFDEKVIDFDLTDFLHENALLLDYTTTDSLVFEVNAVVLMGYYASIMLSEGAVSNLDEFEVNSESNELILINNTAKLIFDESPDLLNSKPLETCSLEIISGATDFSFSENGTKLFLLDGKKDLLFQYGLDKPFNLRSNIQLEDSLKLYVDNNDLNNYSVSDFSFSNDGKRIVVSKKYYDGLYDRGYINDYDLIGTYDINLGYRDMRQFSLKDFYKMKGIASISRTRNLEFYSGGSNLSILDDYYGLIGLNLNEPYFLDTAASYKYLIDIENELKLFEKNESIWDFKIHNNGQFGTLLFGGGKLARLESDSIGWRVIQETQVSEFQNFSRICFDRFGKKVFGLDSHNDKLVQFDLHDDPKTFQESTENNGELDQGDFKIFIDNGKFSNAGGQLSMPDHFVLENLPDGLRPVLDVSEDGSYAMLKILDSATFHGKVHGVDSLIITFNNLAFEYSNAHDVMFASSYKTSWSIEFDDPSAVIWSYEESPTGNDTIVVNVNFSEKVEGLTVQDFVVSNGVISDFQTSDGKDYFLSIMPSESGNVDVELIADGAEDINGNPNQGAKYSIIYVTPCLSYNVQYFLGPSDISPSEETEFLEDQEIGGISFGDYGRKLFIRLANKEILQYWLNHPYSLDSIVKVDTIRGLEGRRQISFSADGLRMFTGDWFYYGSRIYQYDLRNSFDLNSVIDSVTVLDISNFTNSFRTLAFNLDGTKMLFYCGDGKFYQCTLNTAFDISNGISSYKVRNIESSAYNVSFGPNGKWLYVFTVSGVAKYNFSEVYDIESSVLAHMAASDNDYAIPYFHAFGGGKVFTVDNKTKRILSHNMRMENVIIEEQEGNNGEIYGVFDVFISGTEFRFAGDTLGHSLFYDIENLPVGLTSQVVVQTDGKSAQIIISGKALFHGVINSVPNLNITFYDQFFANGVSSKISNAISGSSHSSIIFNNPTVKIEVDSIIVYQNTFVNKILLSEKMTALDLDSITIDNGNAISLTPIDSISYVLLIQPSQAGLVKVKVDEGVLFDAHGNPNKMSNTVTVNYSPRILQYGDLLDFKNGAITKEYELMTRPDAPYPQDFGFDDLGKSLYLLAQDRLLQYNLREPFELSSLEGSMIADLYLGGSSTNEGNVNTTTYFTPEGNRLFTFKEDYRFGGIGQHRLEDSFEISSPEYEQDGSRFNPHYTVSMSFSNNGLTLFTLTKDGKLVQYSLTEPYQTRYTSIENRPKFVGQYDLGSYYNNWDLDFKFNESGTELYFLSGLYRKILKYQLNRPFDIVNSDVKYLDQYILPESDYGALEFSDDYGKLFVMTYHKYLTGSSEKVVQYKINDYHDFVEASSNDGQLMGEVNIHLANDFFVNRGGQLLSPEHFSIENLPVGLEPVLEVDADGSIAVLKFEGKALAHQPTNDVDSLIFSFTDEAFQYGRSTQILKSINYKSSLSVKFKSDFIAPKPSLSLRNAKPVYRHDTAWIELNFDEMIFDFELQDLTISSGRIVHFEQINQTSFLFGLADSVSGRVDVKVLPGVCQDASGNLNSGSNIINLNYDWVGPELLVQSDSNYFTNQSEIDFVVTFSEASIGFNLSSIALINAEVVTFDSVDQLTYNVTIRVVDDGLVRFSVIPKSFTDLVGNTNLLGETLEYLVDRSIPVAAFNYDCDANLIGEFSLIPVSITFNKKVLGFEAEDILLVEGSINNFINIDSQNYSVDIIPNLIQREVSIFIDITDGSCYDLYGNLIQDTDMFELACVTVLNKELDIKQVALKLFAIDNQSIVFGFEKGVYEYQIFDMSGRVVSIGEVIVNSEGIGRIEVELDKSKVYILQVEMETLFVFRQ